MKRKSAITPEMLQQIEDAQRKARRKIFRKFYKQNTVDPQVQKAIVEAATGVKEKRRRIVLRERNGSERSD